MECIHCSSVEEISTDVKKLTRILAEEPYRRPVTDLECVKKIKSQCLEVDAAEDRARDAWIRQLQQIPNVSAKVATSLAEYFPTARSLWIEYQDEEKSEHDKRMILATCCGTGRKNAKLSNNIYRIMTSQDPSEMLR